MPIRPARFEDSIEVSDLIYSVAIKDNAYVFETTNRKAIDFFSFAFERQLGIWSSARTHVFDFDNKAVAMISSYPQSEFFQVMLSGIKAVLKFYGWKESLGVIYRSIRVSLQYSALPKESVYIYNVATCPLHRGQGLSPKLYEKIHEHWRSLGVGRSVVDVSADNQASLRVCEKLGYEFETSKTKKSPLLRLYKSLG